MIYPSSFENKIGFNRIREKIKSYCRSEDSIKCVEDMSFSTHYKLINKQLSLVWEMLNSITDPVKSRCFPADILPSFPINKICVKLQKHDTYLFPEDLLNLRKLSLSCQSIKKFFAEHIEAEKLYPTLNFLTSELHDMQPTIIIIDRVIDSLGEIKDCASKDLQTIREQLRTLSRTADSIIKQVLTLAIRDGIIDNDTRPVMREGRHVIPVPSMHKRSLPGIVHGESSSGRTVYIEPASIVENNNRLKELYEEEKREKIRILKSVSDEIREYKNEIKRNAELLIQLDFIHAKALYADYSGGNKPQLYDNREFEWYHAINPNLKLSFEGQGKEVVPLDIHLDETNRILVISGPNAGGKSVCLKTVASIQYMMQCGILPTLYSNSRMCIFSSIFIDIGDNQSLEDDLSTYSSHLRNMKFFLSHSNSETLILIDEFGSGTEPVIGGAIAESILLQLNRQDCRGVITTHYQNIKHIAEDTPGLENASMLYDRHEMRPLYILSSGNPGSSFAIEIARKIGLPTSIIDSAIKKAGQEYIDADKYLLGINRDRKYWEQKRRDIKIKEKNIEKSLIEIENESATIKAKRKEIIDEARKQAVNIISQSNALIERTIKEIKESAADKEKTKHLRKEIEEFRKQLQEDYDGESFPVVRHRQWSNKQSRKRPTDKVPIAKSHDYHIGDYVQLDGKGQTGEIIQINGKRVKINFGYSTIETDQSRLTPSKRQELQSVRINSAYTSSSDISTQERRNHFKPEIDVRGFRVEEALQAVIHFIDDARQFNVSHLRILHGTGTGALRSAICSYLSGMGDDLQFGDEDVRLGGAGITVIHINNN